MRNAGRLPGLARWWISRRSICSSIASGVVSSVGTATRVRKCEGTPFAKLQGRQKRRAEAEADRAVDQRDRGVDGGDRAQRRENGRAAMRKRPWRRERQAATASRISGDGGDGAGVTANARSPMQARRPLVLSGGR